MNTRIQSLKVWLKSVLPRLKYRIFSRGLFFIGAPCIYGITQCYLPSSRGDIPPFPPLPQQIKVGTRFSDPEGIQG